MPASCIPSLNPSFARELFVSPRHGCTDAQRDAASTEIVGNNRKNLYFKKNPNNPLFLQIGSLENYYHFHHSKTFKRSTLSSRGPHNFLRMDPKVQGRVAQVPQPLGG